MKNTGPVCFCCMVTEVEWANKQITYYNPEDKVQNFGNYFAFSQSLLFNLTSKFQSVYYLSVHQFFKYCPTNS